MYFQFLVEDRSTEILVKHIMEKFICKYPEKEIYYDSKSFAGIGTLKASGNLYERKGGMLLNNLRAYLRGFDRSLSSIPNAVIVVVLDNDKRDYHEFKGQLEQVAQVSVMLTDYVFCIAVKEMEAWLLGDEGAILKAYPSARRKYLQNYEQDGICDTWQVLADMVYPKGLKELKKKSGTAYTEIGRAKCEWADKIGCLLDLEHNNSPSFCKFIHELKLRIEAA